MSENKTVYFVGSGPGDPELITLKAKRLVEAADVIIYSGSLLNPKILHYARKDVELHDAPKVVPWHPRRHFEENREKRVVHMAALLRDVSITNRRNCKVCQNGQGHPQTRPLVPKTRT